MLVDSPFSQATRTENIAAMAADPVDLLIIGAGINGAGIARDAAMRGFRTALVDKGAGVRILGRSAPISAPSYFCRASSSCCAVAMMARFQKSPTCLAKTA